MYFGLSFPQEFREYCDQIHQGGHRWHVLRMWRLTACPGAQRLFLHTAARPMDSRGKFRYPKMLIQALTLQILILETNHQNMQNIINWNILCIYLVFSENNHSIVKQVYVWLINYITASPSSWVTAQDPGDGAWCGMADSPPPSSAEPPTSTPDIVATLLHATPLPHTPWQSH